MSDDLDLELDDDDLAPPPVADLSWHDRAACLGSDPNVFFPERGESTTAAKQVCATCSVRDECLEYALVNRIKFGIFGGKSERERRALRKAARPDDAPRAEPLKGAYRKPINHGTPGGYHQHRRRSEEPCVMCRQAYNARGAERQAERRARLRVVA